MENDDGVNHQRKKNALKKPLPEHFKTVMRGMGVNNLYYDMTRKKCYMNIGCNAEKQLDAILDGKNPFGEGDDLDCFGEAVDAPEKPQEARDALVGEDMGDEVFLDDVEVSKIELECIRQDVSTHRISRALTVMAHANSRCFISEWICSKPWDGQSRIAEWISTLKCADGFDSTLKVAYMYRWALSAIAILFNGRGTSVRGVLVLQGAQGLGKTSWIKKLCDACPWAIGTGVSLNPHDKDSKEQAYSKWIIELGELDSTLRRDIGALKAEITKDTDEWRKSYGEHSQVVPRRTVFCASVNDDKFLKDPTGNSRFWVLPVTDINYEHKIDMQQFWAEVYHSYADGEQWHLTADESKMQVEHSRLFEEVCPIAELIDSQLNWDLGCSEWMNATQVAKSIGIKEPKKSDANTVSRVLKQKYIDMPNMVRVLDGRRIFLVPAAKNYQQSGN